MNLSRRSLPVTAVAGSLLVALFAARMPAADYRVDSLQEPAPKEALSDEISASLMDQGIQVIRGASRVVCEIWPCKQWNVQADFQPTPGVLYPFQPGSLIGVIRFPGRGHDFRDQRISSGVYTLRYALQPVDGNHVGTSVTRDFLLMVEAEQDQTVELIDNDRLMELAAEAARATHPAMLSLKSVKDKSASIRHDESEDWWIANVTGKAKSDEATEDLTLAVVVVGHADE